MHQKKYMAKKRGFNADDTEDLPKAKINKASLQKTKRLFTFIGEH